MSNIYVKRYSEILKEHYKKMQEYENEIRTAKERYSEEYQSKVIDDINRKKQNASNRNKNRIMNLHNDIVSMIAKSSFPNVEALTADRLLFEDGGLDFTPTEVKAFIERYSDNPTMLRIIQNWLVKHHEADTKMNEYADCYLLIISPEKKAECYRTFAEGALTMIDRIDSDPNMSPLFIDGYGDETVGKDLYKYIGNGLELTVYANRNVPDTVLQSYDSYLITADSYTV